MFEFTCNILRKGLREYKEEMEEYKDNIDDMMPYLRKMGSLSGFIEKVDKKELQPEIMKALSSTFFMDTSKHKLLVDKQNKKPKKPKKTITIKAKKAK
jgi:hypothetical protein